MGNRCSAGSSPAQGHARRWVVIAENIRECGCGNAFTGNAFGRVRASVCPVRALTFENLDLEISFLVCMY